MSKHRLKCHITPYQDAGGGAGALARPERQANSLSLRVLYHAVTSIIRQNMLFSDKEIQIFLGRGNL